MPRRERLLRERPFEERLEVLELRRRGRGLSERLPRERGEGLRPRRRKPWLPETAFEPMATGAQDCRARVDLQPKCRRLRC